jgi:hypothetical protein
VTHCGLHLRGRATYEGDQEKHRRKDRVAYSGIRQVHREAEVGTKRNITIDLGELCSVTDTACFFRVHRLYLHQAHIASPVESYREKEGNPARGLVLEH